MFLSAKLQKIFFTIALIAIFIIAWVLQARLLLNWDVSWDIRVSQRMLAGGTYVKNFFDTNPPLIFYLYMPAVFLAKFCFISVASALRVYVFLLSAFSLAACYDYSQKIFAGEKPWLLYYFVLTIAVIFLVLPLIDFGQREHLLVILCLPYLLGISYRFQGNKLNFYSCMLIGLAGGMGFAIKPYFLFAPALIEIYFIYRSRKLFNWMRPEVITLIIFLVIYTASIFIFYPEYTSTIVPLGMMFYYSGFEDPMLMVLTEPVMFFWLLGLLLYWRQPKNTYRVLTTVLMLASLGFVIAYVMQRTAWRYHYLPMFSIMLILSALLIIKLKLTKNYFSYLQIFIIAPLAIAFPLVYFENLYPYSMKFTENHSKLIQFLQTHAENKSVYFFSANPNGIFPAVTTAPVIYDSRFQHLFWLPGMLKQLQASVSGKLSPDKINGENTLIKMLYDDLEKIKPDFIFVDTEESKKFFKLMDFNYLNYFFQDAKFIALWKQYRYITTIESGSNQPENPAGWNLYIQPDYLKPEATKGKALILAGTGRDRIIYFAVKQKIMPNLRTPLIRHIHLSKQQFEFLAAQPSLSAISNTTANSATVNSIINKAFNAHAFEYQVYKRIS